METFIRTSGHDSGFMAFFMHASGDVQVTVRRELPTGPIITLDSTGSATKIQGNVEVTYPKGGRQARRVLRALALLQVQNHG